MSQTKKPAPKKQSAQRKQDAEEITRLKDKFVEYFKEVPVQKYAGMYIGRTEQTIIEWLKSDTEFFNRVQEARADWVKKKATRVKAEFALERLEKEIWAQRTELTGAEGEPLQPTVVRIIDQRSTNKKGTNDESART